MRFGTWDILLNFAFLLLWTQIWMEDRWDMRSNPLLSGFGAVQEKVVEFFRPLLPFLSVRWCSAVVLLFFIVARAFIVPANTEWKIVFGFAVATVNGSSLLSRLTVSILSFAVFIFKLWGLALIYAGNYRHVHRHDSTEALYLTARPFSYRTTAMRVMILLVFGMFIYAGMLGANALSMADATENIFSLPNVIGQALIVSVSGWVALLPLIQSLVLLLIIGSLLAGFAGSQSLGFFCNEILDVLMGPLGNYRIRIGVFDLTPLIFMFVLGFVHGTIQVLLFRILQWM